MMCSYSKAGRGMGSVVSSASRFLIRRFKIYFLYYGCESLVRVAKATAQPFRSMRTASTWHQIRGIINSSTGTHWTPVNYRQPTNIYNSTSIENCSHRLARERLCEPVRSKQTFLHLHAKPQDNKGNQPLNRHQSYAVIINPIVTRFCFQNRSVTTKNRK